MDIKEYLNLFKEMINESKKILILGGDYFQKDTFDRSVNILTNLIKKCVKEKNKCIDVPYKIKQLSMTYGTSIIWFTEEYELAIIVYDDKVFPTEVYGIDKRNNEEITGEFFEMEDKVISWLIDRSSFSLKG